MCQKIAILPHVAPKPKLKSKNFRRMTPPKVGFLNKVSGAQKSFFGPPKTEKKLIFSKNPISVIYLNMGVVKGVVPATLIVSVRPLGVIH